MTSFLMSPVRPISSLFYPNIREGTYDQQVVLTENVGLAILPSHFVFQLQQQAKH